MPRKPRRLVLVGSVAGSLILIGWSSAASSARTPTTHTTITPIAAVLLTKTELAAEAKNLHQSFYWAGAMKGHKYEFRRTSKGDVYVRYLPNGVPVGASGAKYLVVATFPVRGAYPKLKKQANGSAVPGPDGSIVFVSPNDPKAVFMAFRGIDYEIEIYFYRPARALAIATSGRVQRLKA